MFHLTGTPETTNTDLAAALGTIGIDRDPTTPLRVLTGDVDRVAFFFLGASACGRFTTQAMMEAWENPDFRRTHPRHPLIYCQIALCNLKRLRDYAAGRSRVGIARRPGGQLEAIHLRGEVNRLEPITSSGSAPAADALRTEDAALAALLLAVGVPLSSSLPVTRTGSRLVFNFAPRSLCGQMEAAPLMLAVLDETWHGRHPEHPFAYAWCALQNRGRLLAEVREKKPLITLLRGGHAQFLTIDAPAEMETEFMRKIKNL
jgi:hypothetical protein